MIINTFVKSISEVLKMELLSKNTKHINKAALEDPAGRDNEIL